jgi:mercuric ion binding protein
MKHHLSALILAALVAPVWSATTTVTLSVPDMNCAACPITVKKALTKVGGVAKVEVSLGKREAVVTFDDSKAAVGQLTRATTEAGYPSTAKETAR